MGSRANRTFASSQPEEIPLVQSSNDGPQCSQQNESSFGEVGANEFNMIKDQLIEEQKSPFLVDFNNIVVPPVIWATLADLKRAINLGYIRTLLNLLQILIETDTPLFLETSRPQTTNFIVTRLNRYIHRNETNNSVESCTSIARKRQIIDELLRNHAPTTIPDAGVQGEMDHFASQLNECFPRMGLGVQVDGNLCLERARKLVEDGEKLLKKWCTRQEFSVQRKLFELPNDNDLQQRAESTAKTLPQIILAHHSLSIMVKQKDVFEPFLKIVLKKVIAINENDLLIGYHNIILPPMIRNVLDTETTAGFETFKTILKILRFFIEIQATTNEVDIFNESRKEVFAKKKQLEKRKTPVELIKLVCKQLGLSEAVLTNGDWKCMEEVERRKTSLDQWFNDSKPIMKRMHELATDGDGLSALEATTESNCWLGNARVYPSFSVMLNNTELFSPFLEVTFQQLDALNQRFKPNLDSILHCAIRNEDQNLIQLLLKQRTLNINIRNRQKETGLYVLCQKYDLARKKFRVNETKRMEENEQRNWSEVEFKQREEEIDALKRYRKGILELLEHKANFNICSSNSKAPLPYDVLWQFKFCEGDLKIERPRSGSLNRKDKTKAPCHCQTNTEALVSQSYTMTYNTFVGQLLSKQHLTFLERLQLDESIFFNACDKAMEKAGHGNILKRIDNKFNASRIVEPKIEILEILLQFREKENFIKMFNKLKVDEKNVKEVIKVLLHSAVELDLPECVKAIAKQDLIFRFSKSKSHNSNNRYANEVNQPANDNLSPNNDSKSNNSNNDRNKSETHKNVKKLLVYREEHKELLQKACNAANADTLSLLLEKMHKDIVFINESFLLVYTLKRYVSLPKDSTDRPKLWKCAQTIASKKQISQFSTDSNGDTAMHISLKYGHLEIAKTLIATHDHVMLGVKNHKGETPLDYVDYDTAKNLLDQCIKIDHLKRELSIKLGFNSCKDKKLDNQFDYAAWIDHIAGSARHRQLLNHPVVYITIMLGWLQFWKWHFYNLILTIVAIIVVTWYSIELIRFDQFNVVLYVFVVICTLLITTREILQMMLFRAKYFNFLRNKQNIFDLAMIVLMTIICTLYNHWFVNGLVIILLALQIIRLIGSLSFGAASTYECMFRKVSWNFFVYMLIYSPLLLAFSCSFYLYYSNLHRPVDSPANTTAIPANSSTEPNNTEDASDSFFHTFGSIRVALYKMAVMSTGEFDAASMHVHDLMIIIFLLFIFCVVMVMQNLINGLAVSDIAKIRSESGSTSLEEKISLLTELEAGFPKLPYLKCLRNWTPKLFSNQYVNHIKVELKGGGKIQVCPKSGTGEPKWQLFKCRTFLPMGILKKCDSVPWIQALFIAKLQEDMLAEIVFIAKQNAID